MGEYVDAIRDLCFVVMSILLIVYIFQCIEYERIIEVLKERIKELEEQSRPDTDEKS